MINNYIIIIKSYESKSFKYHIQFNNYKPFNCMFNLMGKKLFRKNILSVESTTNVISTVWMLIFTSY